jgi:[amino group carrier protein]-L-2-aminoadipate 6-kinase
VLILKIGGGRDVNIEGIAGDLVSLTEPAIVVHGANAWRDDLAKKLGVQVEVVTSVRGYDSVLSTDDTLDLLLMAYAGLRNKRIVETFQRRGIQAIGLTGLDGRVIQGKRNAGIQCRQGNKILVRHDLSGKPQRIDTTLLDLLLEKRYVPVMTVPICDEEGRAISADNDDIVATLHASYHAAKIVSLLEAPGFLSNPSDPSSVLPHMSRAEVERWESQSSGRIKRKLHAITKLLQEFPTAVYLGDGRTEHPLQDALAGKGTVIQ